jgi:hypothetical protein
MAQKWRFSHHKLSVSWYGSEGFIDVCHLRHVPRELLHLCKTHLSFQMPLLQMAGPAGRRGLLSRWYSVGKLKQNVIGGVSFRI